MKNTILGSCFSYMNRRVSRTTKLVLELELRLCLYLLKSNFVPGYEKLELKKIPSTFDPDNGI